MQLEYEIVVPTGDLLVANECQNPDLFFALRGGGGGTLGMVMQVTTQALPRAELVTYAIIFAAPSFHRLANMVSATFKPATSIEKFLEFVIPYSVGWASDGKSFLIARFYSLTISLFRLEWIHICTLSSMSTSLSTSY